MKNKTVLIILATLTTTVLLFNGCGKKEIETETVVSEIVEETEDTEPVEEVEETEIVEDIVEEPIEVEETDNIISDNWEDLEFLLEGIKFKLPCPIKELEKTDWVFHANGGIERNVLPHLYYGSDPALYHETKRGHIVMRPYNDTDETIDVAECITDSIRFERDWKDNVINVVLAKGITYGSAKQEVLEAYGEPAKTSSGSVYTHLYYESADESVGMHISLDENGYVNGITLCYDEFLRELRGY